MYTVDTSTHVQWATRQQWEGELNTLGEFEASKKKLPGWEGRPENGATFQEVERVNEQAVRSTVSTSQGDVRRRLQRCWKVAFHDLSFRDFQSRTGNERNFATKGELYVEEDFKREMNK